MQTLKERSELADRDLAVRKINMGDLITISPILREIMDRHQLGISVAVVDLAPKEEPVPEAVVETPEALKENGDSETKDPS